MNTGSLGDTRLQYMNKSLEIMCALSKALTSAGLVTVRLSSGGDNVAAPVGGDAAGVPRRAGEVGVAGAGGCN